MNKSFSFVNNKILAKEINLNQTSLLMFLNFNVQNNRQKIAIVFNVCLKNYRGVLFNNKNANVFFFRKTWYI